LILVLLGSGNFRGCAFERKLFQSRSSVYARAHRLRLHD
jgi:hypothetical protein